MSDFNFFSPYLREKRNNRQKKLFIIAVSSLFVIGLLAFTSLNIYLIYSYKNEISNVESYMNSKKTIEMLSKYDDTTEKLRLSKSYYEKASEAASFVKNSNTVNAALLDKLSSVMPQDAIMINLAINYNIIEIQYKMNDLSSVAEIEHNLKSLNIFDNVHVSTVNNEIGYIAIINCSLKDVITSEAETDK